MKALYSRAYLDHISFNDMLVPFERYLFKLEHERKKIPKLKFHERDFLFRAMHSFYEASGDKRYDIYKIPELHENLFYWIVLLHSNMTMVFDGFVPGPNKKALTAYEKRRNKMFFYKYLGVWRKLVEEGKGTYLSIIKPALQRKLEEWRDLAKKQSIPAYTLKQKEVYVYGCFFDIYYHVRLYFDELPNPYVIKSINGIDVVFNVYSYVHIYNRHYIPNMSYRLGNASMNPEMDVVNLDELPDSILDMLEKYNVKNPIAIDTEYCLFTWNGDKFILWLKRKRLNETKKEGLEVRSFYKCTKEEDLIKFVNNNWLVLS